MEVLLNLGYGVVVLALLLVPGLLVAMLWAPDPVADEEKSPLPHLLLVFGWSYGVVPFLAFSYALFFRRPLTLLPLVASGLVVTLVAGALWWQRGRTIPVQLQCGWRKAWPVLAAAATVGLLFVLKYDRSIFSTESCMHRVVMQTLHLTDPIIDLLASNRDDQRLGNTAVLSNFVMLFGSMGFRIVYGLVGFFAALGGYLLGSRLPGHWGWAWFVALLLPLNPYVGRMPLIDENLLTMGFSSLFLPLLFRRQIPWVSVGAFLGLVVMMRHVGIFWLPAVCYAVWRSETTRVRPFLSLLVPFTLVTLVGHIHHYVALGSIFKLETFDQLEPIRHRFLGHYNGLLQWPFATSVVRTPWNPFPTFIMWPVYLVAHFGLVLFAGMLAGVVALLRERRTEGIFWLLWMVPLYGILSLQENWDVPNKMGVIFILFHPLVLWCAAGLRAALESPRRWGIAVVLLVLVSWGATAVLPKLEVAADERYYEAWPGQPRENPEYVAQERHRVTRAYLWPDFSRLGEAVPFFRVGKLTGLVKDIADSSVLRPAAPYGWFPGDMVQRELAPVVVEVDLSKRLFDRETPFVVSASSDGEVHLDLSQPGGEAVIPNIQVAWSSRPITLFVTAGQADVTGVAVAYEAWSDDDERRRYLFERYARAMTVLLGWSREAVTTVRTVKVDTDRIRMRVPQGPMSVIETLSNSGNKYHYWATEVGPGSEIRMEGPFAVLHN